MSLILFLALAFTPPPAPWYVIDVAPTPVPPPPPKPSTVVEIGPDELLVVEFRQKSFLLPVDAAIVKVFEDKGPIKIRGKFVGGGGKIQTKSFAGPQVFVIEVAGPGTTVLTWVKVGAQTPADVLQRTVKTGVAPQPPPPDPTPPDPTPTDPLQAAVSAAYLTDSPIDGGMRRAAAAKYIAYYRASGDTCYGSKATNTDQLWTEVQAVENSAGIDLAALPAVRSLLKAEMKKLFPAPTSATQSIDDATRKATAAIYRRFANLLEAAAK